MASGTQSYNIKMFVAILTAGMTKKNLTRIKLKFVIFVFFLCIPSLEKQTIWHLRRQTVAYLKVVYHFWDLQW